MVDRARTGEWTVTARAFGPIRILSVEADETPREPCGPISYVDYAFRCWRSVSTRPLLRDALIVVLAGLVAFVLVHDWVRIRFGPTLAELDAARRARVAEPSPVALHALYEYTRLSVEERNDLHAYLHASLIPVSTWVEQVGEGRFQVICLGEDHESATREFLAREIFAKVFFDVLLLEATVSELRRIDEAIAAGDARVPLLGVDIAAILGTARTRNTGIKVAGIEETKRQRSVRQGMGRDGFRDDSIARNFWDQFEPGRRHGVLIGALHCTDQGNWLFTRLRHEAAPGMAGEMLSVRIVGQHRNQTVADFVHFLDRIGFPRRHFVIVDPGYLHPRLNEWFRLLVSTMRRYHTVLVFRQ